MTGPNVLLIFSDDQRFDFLDYMPNTRNLLAFQGRVFQNARCNVSVCEPSRQSLLTGQNSIHRGATIDDSNTIGAWMQAAGYRTGMIGKYLNSTPPLIPKPGGWDTWLQLDETGGYNAYGYQVSDGVTLATPTPAQLEIDYLHDQAKTFIQGSQPWFLLWTPTSPHIPFDPDPRDLFAWSDVRWPLVIEDDVSDKPSWIANQPPLPQWGLANFRAAARGQLREGTGLDRAIGDLVGSLAPAVLDNTLVIYASDNGMMYGEHRLPEVGIFKNCEYDPGMHVPLVIRGSGFPTGVSVEPVYIAADMTATVLAVGGATAGLPADGIDLRDMVANPSSYTARQLLHYKGVSNNFLDGSFFSPRGNGISTLTRKLYRYDLSSFPAGTTPLATDEYEAYDLDVDPNEWNNWANDPTRRTERDTLEAALNALLAS